MVSHFQFVLRFTSSILECSSLSCGTFTPGSAWTAFGDKVTYSPDAGQVDFATTASVATMGKSGLLDIGTLCLPVAGAGELELQMQKKVHISGGVTQGCSASHMFVAEPNSRCFTHTAQVSLGITAPSGRRLLAQAELKYLEGIAGDAAQQAAERAVKDNDDDSARKYLTARIALDKRCAVAEAEAVDATQRLKRAEADVEALRVRCDDLDYLVARAVVAKSRGEAVSPFPGGAEDSLLARFRALEEE